ncbi:MAG TPA: CoA-binding protein [Flavisolibacter sp.]|nr:CoA-binding protein [Flavisolibacter sp.]
MAGKKKTVVLGASQNPSRYSYLAIQRLRAHNHPVVAVGRREGQVADVAISKEHPKEDGVDTVTLYLNPGNQVPYYDYILDLQPKRIIFNPGTENDELIRKAKENNIQPVIACTLVMLSTGQY